MSSCTLQRRLDITVEHSTIHDRTLHMHSTIDPRATWIVATRAPSVLPARSHRTAAALTKSVEADVELRQRLRDRYSGSGHPRRRVLGRRRGRKHLPQLLRVQNLEAVLIGDVFQDDRLAVVQKVLDASLLDVGARLLQETWVGDAVLLL